MSKTHKNTTLSFRPSVWQRALIDERVRLSGLAKNEFYTRCCVYSNIVVVGKKENIQRIVDAAETMQEEFRDIVRLIQSDDVSFSEEMYVELKNDVLATAITVVDILNGAAYLFDKKSHGSSVDYKERCIDISHKES